jgi:hypothetical protein
VLGLQLSTSPLVNLPQVSYHPQQCHHHSFHKVVGLYLSSHVEWLLVLLMAQGEELLVV